MRLFIAVSFSEELKRGILYSISGLTSKFPHVSWVRQDNLHLTIKFLGRLRQIKSDLSKAKGWKDESLEKIENGIKKCIKEIKPFTLYFDRIGYFDRRQLIVWIGIKFNPKLLTLVKCINVETEKLGYLSEKRPFAAHVTVGRVKRAEKKLRESIRKQIGNMDFSCPKPFGVTEIALVNSTLTSSGVSYTCFSQFALL